MSGLRLAVAFLTRVPANPGERPDLASSVPWFPVVGAAVGVAVAGVYAGSVVFLPPVVAASLAIGFGMLATGALHEDGLADVADAFGLRRDREETLRIMRDPRHGTFGVGALVIGVLLRVGALASFDGWAALAALPAAHALSRSTAVMLMRRVPPAREGGIAASHASAIGRRHETVAAGAGLAISLAALGIWSLPGAALCGLAAWMLARLAVRRIGGITGDVLGATQQVCEILILLGAAGVLEGGLALVWWR